MIRTLIFSLAAFSLLPLSAGTVDEPVLTDARGNYLASVKDIAFLMASDTDDSFTIVCGDGTLVPGVVEARVADMSGVGIAGTPAAAARPVVVGSVERTLTIAGCAAGTSVGVFDLAGRRVLGAVSSADTVCINVGALPAGVYMLRVGNTGVKFVKK